MDKNVYHIKPAGRHILTIGKDLIKDKYAAIIELVKNAYDADATDINVKFKKLGTKNKLFIVISDNGHGMSRDIVINKWLVPSTDDKLIRQKSPNGRLMQGRKGIGRYAASILGSDLLLETINEGEKTELFLEWNDFVNAEFLNDVEILVNTKKTNQKNGTILTITSNIEVNNDWDENEIKNLEFELKRLIPPIDLLISEDNIKSNFNIYLEYENFYESEELNTKTKIVPYPIFDFYDYRIYGFVDIKGDSQIIYHNNKIKNTKEEIIDVKFVDIENCGKVVFDIRVYDREASSIDDLIKRGLKSNDGSYLDRAQVRYLLDKYNGIGVFRNGFRIRPLGDPDFDWLELNKKRVQKPAQRIGSNQVIGYVIIESEEKSHLEEKSARDGIKDNIYYSTLKNITNEIINQLEVKRYAYRKIAGLGRSSAKIENSVISLYNFEDLKSEIIKKLEKEITNKKLEEEILAIINDKEESNNKIVDEIRKNVAIYQGQATLGKIVNVILHEGRKPLNYFKNQIPNIIYWANKFSIERNNDILEKIITRSKGFGIQAEVLVDLFSRIDHLAAKKRDAQTNFKLKQLIKKSLMVFEKTITDEKISYEINCPDNFKIFGWEQDFYVIFTNLIDNSIYWLNSPKVKTKAILIDVINDNEKILHIDYKDNGLGIEQSLIESEVIFEPEFSTKPSGTGLGLAIAGEAALRNNFELKAFYSDIGAYFRLENKAGG